MQPPKKTKKNSTRKWWLIIIVATFFILTGGALVFGAWYSYTYKNKIFLGVHVAGEDLSGLTKKQAFEILEKKKEGIVDSGIFFSFEDHRINLPPALVATDPNLAHSIFSLNMESTAERAYSLGRDKNIVHNILTQILLLQKGKNIHADYTINEDEIYSVLQLNFDELQSPPQNAKLVIDASLQEFSVEKENEGWLFEYQKALDTLKKNLGMLKNETISLTKNTSKPTIYQRDVLHLLDEAKNRVDNHPQKIIYENKEWEITKKNIASWLEFQETGIKKVGLGLNKEKIYEYLSENIEPSVNVEAVDAIFELQDGRVKEFRPSREGLRIEKEKAYSIISQAVLSDKDENILLEVEVQKPKVATRDLNELGIVELLGRGHSNFKGSPQNRRHNIGVGTKSLNGILIPPGEEFSTLAALGDINGENGYREELVIKGDRTIPEYGGGLCQVSTTLFRSALQSGLQITQRRNHSYRVIYYEPAGIDATIYSPAPDLRFQNDTGHHILIITRIEGDDLFYEMYGTKDGRTVEVPEKAEIYNTTKPGPVKYVETDELPPGEQKRVERPISGADTKFTYKVIYLDGTVKEEIFESHYVAWPEVWLVGKDPNASEVGQEDGVMDTQIPENLETMPSLSDNVQTPENSTNEVDQTPQT